MRAKMVRVLFSSRDLGFDSVSWIPILSQTYYVVYESRSTASLVICNCACSGLVEKPNAWLDKLQNQSPRDPK